MAIRKSRKLNKVIENKQKVSFNYVDIDNKASSRKDVEVVTMGYDHKGHSAIRAWDPRKGWRMFHTSAITNFKVEDKKYRNTKPGYNQFDKGMDFIVKSTTPNPSKKKK